MCLSLGARRVGGDLGKILVLFEAGAEECSPKCSVTTHAWNTILPIPAGHRQCRAGLGRDRGGRNGGESLIEDVGLPLGLEG